MRIHPLLIAGAAAVAIGVACSNPRPSSAPAPTGASPQPSAAPGMAAGGAGGAGQTTRPRRPPPNPRVQDSLRRNMVNQILTQIAGRENEAAGTVFKNVKLSKAMPAGQFLKMMDEQYGRGLGMVCGNCHIPQEWDKDDRKNKVIARQMQAMTDSINLRLATVKELDEDRPPATCVMCHRGTGHPPSTMPVLDQAAPPRGGFGPPPGGPPPGAQRPPTR